MSSQPIIAPSILSGDFSEIGPDTLRMLENKPDWFHVDIMDGHFVPNISFGPMVVKALRTKVPKTLAFFDCHMMVSNPLQWIGPMADAGGDQYTFHYEAAIEMNQDPHKVIEEIRKHGMKVGMGIKPKTQINDQILELAPKCDMVLVMTVEPGFGGQKFMGDMMPKVEQLRSKFPKLNIQVDGGLDTKTVEAAAKAGANVIVAGTSVYKADDPRATIDQLRQAVCSCGGH